MAPYQQHLQGRDAAAVIAATSAHIARIAASATDLDAAHAPGKWSLREVLCHLADCEIAWAWRLRFAHENDNGVLQPFDQDAWARAYAGYTAAEALATFTALRAWNVAFVTALTDAHRQKPVTHPDHGAWTLWTLVQVMAGHDLHHLAILDPAQP